MVRRIGATDSTPRREPPIEPRAHGGGEIAAVWRVEVLVPTHRVVFALRGGEAAGRPRPSAPDPGSTPPAAGPPAPPDTSFEAFWETLPAADREIRSGRYRGPLHGIPWGAKDLFATRGIPTTFGAAPYQKQVIDYDATVVERLRDAGVDMLVEDEVRDWLARTTPPAAPVTAADVVAAPVAEALPDTLESFIAWRLGEVTTYALEGIRALPV